MANKTSYDASRTASHKSVPAPLLFYIYICDLPTTVPFSSTSTSVTCQPPSPDNMYMLMT